MKNKILLFLLAISITACSKHEKKQPSPDNYLISKVVLNNTICQQLLNQEKFNWFDADARTIWSAAASTDSIISIGYCLKGQQKRGIDFSSIDLTDVDWVKSRKIILELVYQSELLINKEVQRPHLVIWSSEYLPVLTIKISNPKTIELLRQSNYVRYVEPTGFDVDFSMATNRIVAESGCDANTPNNQLVQYSHYTNLLPNSKASWNYAIHGITDSWARTSGVGIKVFLIDTGCSSNQENLNTAFNQGYSVGRTIEKLVTIPRNTLFGLPIGPIETTNDVCGHGTMMAGVLAAPRGTDGNMIGVAYNSNLIACRASLDVHIDESREVKGVADAFVTAANRNDVKIISMSLGRVLRSAQIEDAVLYASQKNKLIFCAAGTSLSWTSGWAGVIFPASMNEVQAVTGVKQFTNFTSCTTCHKGSEVDFVVVMERAGDNVHPLTLASFGDYPSTVGGSSVSTATMAGMAALVWSRFPFLSKEQLLSRLQKYSSFYPLKHTQWGWGILQVNQATL
jgi:hypothetical protein